MVKPEQYVPEAQNMRMTDSDTYILNKHSSQGLMNFDVHDFVNQFGYHVQGIDSFIVRGSKPLTWYVKQFSSQTLLWYSTLGTTVVARYGTAVV